MSSEESEIAAKVLAMLGQLSEAIRQLVTNQEKITAEQSKAAKAIGECGILLTTHGTAITQLLQHCGLLGDDSAPPSSSAPLN